MTLLDSLAIKGQNTQPLALTTMNFVIFEDFLTVEKVLILNTMYVPG